MNKLFSKIAALSVGLAMAVGVGVAVSSSDNSKEPAPVEAATIGTHLTQVTELVSGNKYVIVGNNNGYALPTNPTLSSGKVAGTTIASVPNDGSGFLWTFTKSGDYWLIGDGSKYIYHSNGGSSGTNLAYGDSTTYKWKLTYSSSTQDHWTFKAVNGTTENSRGMLCNGTNFGGYALSNESSYKFMNIYEAAATETYTVSFNGNGGTGEMSSVSDVSGNYTLPASGFIAPSDKAFSGWKASNAGDLIPAGGSYNVSSDVTFFAQWVDAYDVSYSAGEHGSGTFSHGLQPGENYQLLAFSELEGISAASGYRFKNYTVGGVDKNPGDTISFNAATTITVNFEVAPMDTTYSFIKAWGWGTTYGPRTINGKTEASGDFGATVYLSRANIQSSGVGSDRPYICGNTNADAKMITFTLTETGYKIVDVLVTFEQRGSNTPSLKLFKGDTNTGSPLDSATIGTKDTLSTSNLNDTVFTVTLNAGGTSNKGCGLTSIYISLTPLSDFGTLDHISITGLPNVVYHVGEAYSSAGFAVTAYDGEDESTANFKDVTSQVSQTLEDAYVFVANDVPGWEEEVEYTEDEKTVSATYHVYVYALADYELVTSEPSDWSGNYLIVGTKDESKYAFNGGLELLDILGNHKEVTSDANDVINSGQELEWTFAQVTGGYSIRGKSGKYIGWASGSNNGLTASDTPLVNTLSFSSGSVQIAGSGGRKLTFNTDEEGRFRYYTSGTVKLYRLKTSDHADEYAQTFLGAIKCDATGENEPDFNIKEGEIKWSWALLASAYNELTSVEKEEFRLGVASKTGNNIEQALARYDLIVGKYGKDKYSDFMLRNPDPIPTNNVTSVNFESNNSLIIIVIAISSATVLSLGVLLAIKKKKHN